MEQDLKTFEGKLVENYQKYYKYKLYLLIWAIVLITLILINLMYFISTNEISLVDLIKYTFQTSLLTWIIILSVTIIIIIKNHLKFTNLYLNYYYIPFQVYNLNNLNEKLLLISKNQLYFNGNQLIFNPNN